MKNLTILTLPLIIIFTFFSGSLMAQSTDRYDRDIQIAEGIIEELFRADDTSRPFGSRHIRDVSGRYIPGYGIHFRISARLTPAVVKIVLQKQAEIHIDEDPDPEELRELGREFVEQRFLEYLKNYAPLFKNLPENEVIRLTIGPHYYTAGAISIWPGDAGSRRTVANITAWATASDIQAYSRQSISDEEFESRVEIANLGERETERDQTVFASILQTSLADVSDTIRVRRTPDVEYLPGLGISYGVNASLSGGSWFDFGDIQIEEFKIETDSLSIDFSNIFEEIDFDEIGRIAERVDSAFARNIDGSEREELEQAARELRQNVMEQRRETLSDETVRDLVDQFHTALTQTVKDYGPTLRSLDTGDMLMITINWSGRHDALPARTELRIRKSDILDGDDPVIEEVQRR